MNKIIVFMMFVILYTTSTKAADEQYSIFYKIQRLFGPSSTQILAKMNQDEKDYQLKYYMQKSIPTLSLFSNPIPSIDFQPLSGSLGDIRYLIEHGASPECQVLYRWTYCFKVGGIGLCKPLYLLLQSNDIKGVQMLLKRGVQLNNIITSRGGVGDPLTFAQTKEMAELLLRYGAKININLNDPEHFIGFPTLITALSQSSHQPELIPLYLSQYNGEKAACAQIIWKYLIKEKRYYDELNLQEQFLQKKNYLREAGAIVE